MEDLLNILEKFAIVDDFDLDLDKLNLNLDEKSEDIEWEKFSENYSKLKYIDQLIKCYCIMNKKKFYEVLKLFLDEIDKTNEYYLNEINFSREPIYKIEALEIEELLEKSLTINDVYEKLETILKAYAIFMPMIENYRKDIFVEKITDTDFLQTFKKRKI